jgi:exopolysaccharide biosynthesis protein
MAVFHALALLAQLLTSDWRTVAPGIEYREFRRNGMHAHVVRVDLRNRRVRVAATNERDKGIVLSEFARRYGAIVAINGDYFDETMRVVGHARGSRGTWKNRFGTRNQPVIGFGRRHAAIVRPESRASNLPRWMKAAVSGWPIVVETCEPLTSSQLPGSDSFTRAPHPRTAVGLSRDGRILHLVVADGRREDVPGLTLEELGRFMNSELSVCSALNLDGGGSTEMIVDGKIVNRPSDGSERRVANHLGVVTTFDRQP